MKTLLDAPAGTETDPNSNYENLQRLLRIVASYFRPLMGVDSHCRAQLIHETGMAIMQRLGLDLQFPSSKHAISRWKGNYLNNPTGLSYGISIDHIQEIQQPNKLLQRVLHPGSGRIQHPNARQVVSGFILPFMKVRYENMAIPNENILDVVEIGQHGVKLFSSASVSDMLYGHRKPPRRSLKTAVTKNSNKTSKEKSSGKTFVVKPPPVSPSLPAPSPQRGKEIPRKNIPTVSATGTTGQNKKSTAGQKHLGSSSKKFSGSSQYLLPESSPLPPVKRGRGRPRKILPAVRVPVTVSSNDENNGSGKKYSGFSSSSNEKFSGQNGYLPPEASPMLPVKRGRGRPRRTITQDPTVSNVKNEAINAGKKRPRSSSSSSEPPPNNLSITANASSKINTLTSLQKPKPSVNPAFAILRAPLTSRGKRKQKSPITPGNRGKTMRLIEGINKKLVDGKGIDAEQSQENGIRLPSPTRTRPLGESDDDEGGSDWDEDFSFLKELASKTKVAEIEAYLDNIPDPEKFVEEPYEEGFDFPEEIKESVVNLDALTHNFVRELEDGATLPDISPYIEDLEPDDPPEVKLHPFSMIFFDEKFGNVALCSGEYVPVGVPIAENVPGIPLAPIGRRNLQASDYDYLERKRQFLPRLPFYNKEEIARQKNPFYMVLLYEMMQAGYALAVRELAQIFRRGERHLDKSGISEFQKLISDKKKVYMIADILRASEEYENEELFETAAIVRRELGQKMMKEKDIPLSKHFLHSALLISEKATEKTASLDRLQAEIHCLLAFIARENSQDHETALDSAVNHLAICRHLSKENQSWHFGPRVLSIFLKKPIALHGLRDEYENVDACSMSLYMIATLLEHEMMLGLADQILHSHKYPSDQDIAQAHVFADTALRLAFEVHHSVALSSALLRFGIVLRHAGEYKEAIKYFKQLSDHSEITGDNETFAIAQHNIAMSHMAKHESMEALECLTKQKEIADTSGIMDLQADALEELGLILLQEGQLWEAEECYASAYECFKAAESETTTTSYQGHCQRNFGMWAIAAGHQLWSRFAGLARNGDYEGVSGLIEWKSRRTPIPKVPRPDYTPERVSHVFVPYHLDEEDEAEEDTDNSDGLMTTLSSRVTIKESILSRQSTTHSDVANAKVKSSRVTTSGGGEYMSDINHAVGEEEKRKRDFESKRSSRRSMRSKKSHRSGQNVYGTIQLARESVQGTARPGHSLLLTPSVSGSDSSVSVASKKVLSVKANPGN